MNKNKILVNKTLNISDARSEEITKDIIDTLMSKKIVDNGIKKLMERYDAESLLAGMQLMRAIDYNAKLAVTRENRLVSFLSGPPQDPTWN